MVNDAACPGALHVVAARDGLLARVRVPGGYITTEAFRRLADLCERDADGAFDITARANVQIRGLRAQTVAAFGEGLIAAGLVTSRAHERVRNVLASPFAGYDATERVDVRSVVRAFDALLAGEPELASLPAKFVVAIDGGGFALDCARADLALIAVPVGSEVRFGLAVGGVDTGLTVAAHDGAALLIAASHAAHDIARRTCGDDRTWRLGRLAGSRQEIAARLRELPYAAVTDVPAFDVARATMTARLACGTANAQLRRGLSAAHTCAFVNVVPSVPLGRLSAVQARGLATLAERLAAKVRLGMWRGVALVGISRADVAVATDGLGRLGLLLDGADGYDGVAACAGMAGCGSALADVRADAAAFAARVASMTHARPWTINVAGCDKRCAMRSGANCDLVARAHGYDVVVDGVLVASEASPHDALERAFASFARANAEALA